MKQLIAAVLDPAVRDFNLDVQRAQDLDTKTFDSVVSSMPMLSDRRVFVVRDAGALRKDTRKAVEQYLGNPSPDVVLLLIDSDTGKTDKDLARHATVLEFQPLRADRVPGWIAHYATTEMRTDISPAAVELLQASVGNDLHRLVAELDKLASYCSGREITEEAVAEVVGIRRGETMADLLDAVAQRNVQKALLLMNHVLSEPKTSAVSIVMALATQTVALAWGRTKLDEGFSPGRLQNEYFDLLKETKSPYTGRSWSSAIAAWTSAVPRWEKGSLHRALDALLMADVILKETKLSSEEQILTTLILAICTSDERNIAA